MRPTCGVIDYGMGNFMSVGNMVIKAGGESRLVRTPHEADGISHLIIPGVGSFDRAISLLRNFGWDEYLKTFVNKPGAKLLGICLGAQLLGKSSKEGASEGLGLLDISSEKFERTENYPVPQMKWNSVVATPEAPAWLGISRESRFYFAHSFYLTGPSDLIYATTHYGKDFASIVGKGNVVGFQFHPEKSHNHGLLLLRNFLDWS